MRKDLVTYQKEISAYVFDLIEKLAITDQERGFVSYIMFGMTGVALLRSMGEEDFDEMVKYLKSKTEGYERKIQK